MIHTLDDLEYVFGEESRGDTPEERALSSKQLFTRSQDHLAIFREGAKGRILSAWEALQTFGFERLIRVAEENIIPIVVDSSEPAASIRSRREALGITQEELAKLTGLDLPAIESAENPDNRNPIRMIAKLCEYLGLNEQVISLQTQMDHSLAVRLKTLKQQTPNWNAKLILTINQFSWVIRMQSLLMEWVLGSDYARKRKKFEPDSFYGDRDCPAWSHAYYIAKNTRDILGIEPEEPIPSLQELVNGVLKIPLLLAELPRNIAGVTLEVENNRGIVINTRGLNENVWVRRATIAHELGHLLYDPPQRFKLIKIDDYEELENLTQPNSSAPVDEVEQRANAFAIEFLAPQSAVREMYDPDTPDESVRNIMETFGISFTAACYQIWNAIERKIPFEKICMNSIDTKPNDEWKGKEDFTTDYFPIQSVPSYKRGWFAGYVAKAEQEGYLSEDTATNDLRCTIDEYRQNKEHILEIYHFA